MSRRPEIGNVTLYPDRPLRASDRNGYVLKFFCPLQGRRIRRNCGTRDRREARRIQRECRERLVSGEYSASGGAITAKLSTEQSLPGLVPPVAAAAVETGPTWQDCYERYLEHRRLRIREGSLVEITSRLGIAERILEERQRERRGTAGLLMSEVATLSSLEDLQARLLAGEHCRYPGRSPNTVNTLMGAVMAFLRFCHGRGWLQSVPDLEKVDAEEVMKGRPVTESEFQRMLDAVPAVVGPNSAASWTFALKVLWESGFRVGDLMDFSWDDTRHIHPIWPRIDGRLPTILIPATQKNGKVQEIPMLPGLQQLLSTVRDEERHGWVVNPQSLEMEVHTNPNSFRPNSERLSEAVRDFSNVAIAEACGVSESAVRKWVSQLPQTAERSNAPEDVMPPGRIRQLRMDPQRSGVTFSRPVERLTVERVGRIICRIGEAAGVIVQRADPRTGRREKYASAHDLRRGCAWRLIDAGVSAETLKIVMRHASFMTTEKHYGAIRSAQSAALEIATRTHASARNSELVGGFVGGHGQSAALTADERIVLKS
ncbi:MAG: hypothetical protein ACK5KS_05410, partial [Planctomyces sp.]